MYSNVNLNAHLAAVLFLAAAGLLLLLIIATFVLLVWRRQWLRYPLAALAALVVGYGALLLGFSAFSRERTLAVGEEKYFCELDCHLAYSVQRVERVKSIGSTNAAGEFYVLELRVRFDENTIAPWRPRDVPLTPDPLAFAVVNDRGEQVILSNAGQRAWDAVHGGSRSLQEPLRPGESQETTLIFDVPPGMRSPRLLATSGALPTPVLIGDESSWLHKKTYFKL